MPEQGLWKPPDETTASGVFICHAGLHDNWADSFAENLKRADFRVYNDRDHQRPGEPFPDKIQDAIAASGAALVLMGGRARERDWVREEMSLIHIRKVGDRAFILVPALVEAEDAAFPISASYDMRDRIDFSPPLDRLKYRVGFQQIVSTLRGAPHGPAEP